MHGNNALTLLLHFSIFTRCCNTAITVRLNSQGNTPYLDPVSRASDADYVVLSVVIINLC